MTAYTALTERPPAVDLARERAAALGFTRSCTDDTGRLLRVLASGIRGGVVGELGAGSGVGTAWLASALPPSSRLVTVDLDRDLAASTAALFRDMPNVEVVHGDWRSILDRGPFALLFVDISEAKREGVDAVIDSLAPGGLALLDDLSPEELWPEEWRGKPDEVRERWLNDSRLAATEVRVSERECVILATRTG